MISYSWNSEPIRELFNRSGITQDELALATDIPIGTIRAYLQGKITPSISALITFADYFAVPVDLLLGRCTEEQVKNVLDDYGRHFMEMRRAAYEAYRFGYKIPADFKEMKFVSPWPYNLVEFVNGEAIDYELTEDHEKGIEYALSKLTDQQRSYILAYFRDGKTFAQIGTEFDYTTGAHPRQVVYSGIRRLRYPLIRGYILYGFTLQNTENTLEKKRAALNVEFSRLDTEYVELHKKAEQLDAVREVLNIQGEQLKEKLDAFPTIKAHMILDRTIDELGISVHLYNCLMRAGIRTYGDLARMTENEFFRIRNFGKKSYEEIVKKFLEATGIDISKNRDPNE